MQYNKNSKYNIIYCIFIRWKIINIKNKKMLFINGGIQIKRNIYYLKLDNSKIKWMIQLKEKYNI